MRCRTVHWARGAAPQLGHLVIVTPPSVAGTTRDRRVREIVNQSLTFRAGSGQALGSRCAEGWNASTIVLDDLARPASIDIDDEVRDRREPRGPLGRDALDPLGREGIGAAAVAGAGAREERLGRGAQPDDPAGVVHAAPVAPAG